MTAKNPKSASVEAPHPLLSRVRNLQPAPSLLGKLEIKQTPINGNTMQPMKDRETGTRTAILAVLIMACCVTVSTAETNLALNTSGSGYPSPLESDRGWGGGSYPWQIMDGLGSYPDWPHGLAFTGGHNGSGGSWIEPAGPRQATINFGSVKTFNRVVLWHHGDDHVPAVANLAYWTGSAWMNIAFQRGYDSNYVTVGSGAKPDTYTFAAVTGSKVRYSFDNRGNNILGTPIVHGWLYEMEVFNDNPCQGVSITSQPQPETANEGGAVSFSVTASGTTPFSYQWRFNGAALSGANSATLSLPDVRAANSGIYSVVLGNCAGAVSSADVSLVVVSGTNHAYNIGQIPDATVWVGQTLEFSVYSQDLGNPATFFASPLTAVRGMLSINATTGQFRYTPVPEDKRTFTVRFVARAGARAATQDVQITPQQHLPAEQATFGLAPLHPLPDAESDDYIIRHETTSETEINFNTQPRLIRDVVLMGKDLVFQRGHPNHLFESYNDTADLKSFAIYAERIIVRNALRLPQTEAIIHAREIIFEDPPGPQEKAAIITTPRSITTRAASCRGCHQRSVHSRTRLRQRGVRRHGTLAGNRVRTNGNLAPHTLLEPCQLMFPVPYAIYAANAGSLMS